jgi:Trm5-related predicted tRNA methylase
MKITKSQLKQTIAEELSRLNEGHDLETAIQTIYDEWSPHTAEGRLYKEQLGRLIKRD